MSARLSGVERIAKERERQVTKEGWSDEHDDEHSDGELALVAALYASPIPLFEQQELDAGGVQFTDPWPASWDVEWDKRRNDSGDARRRAAGRIRQLEKAGALIAAEIDRLLRDAEARK